MTVIRGSRHSSFQKGGPTIMVVPSFRLGLSGMRLCIAAGSLIILVMGQASPSPSPSPSPSNCCVGLTCLQSQCEDANIQCDSSCRARPDLAQCNCFDPCPTDFTNCDNFANVGIFRCVADALFGDGVRDCIDGSDEGVDFCGLVTDGKVSAGEECDDGNNASGDGCSDICRIEDGFLCEFQTNSLSNCVAVTVETTQVRVEATGLNLSLLTDQQVTAALEVGAGVGAGALVLEETVQGAGSDATLYFHIIGAVGDSATLSSPSALSTVLTTQTGQTVTVANVTLDTITPLDTTAPTISLNLTADNPSSASVAGPGHTLRLVLSSTSEPLARLDVLSFLVGGIARTLTPQAGSGSPPTVFTYVVTSTDASGAVTLTVEAEDGAGNTRLCSTGEGCLVQPLVTVDTSPPQPSAVDSDVNMLPQTAPGSQRSFALTTVLSDTGSSIDATNLRVSCPGNCRVTIGNSSVSGAILTTRVDVLRYKSGGTVTLLFRAGALTDSAGNTNPELSIAFTLDEVEVVGDGVFFTILGLAGLMAVYTLINAAALLCCFPGIAGVTWRINSVTPPILSPLVVLAILISLAAVPFAGFTRRQVSQDNRQLSCRIFPQLISHGVMLLLSLMLASLLGIQRAASEATVKSGVVPISARYFTCVVALCMGCNAVIMTTWGVLHPNTAVLAPSSEGLWYRCHVSDTGLYLLFGDIALFVGLCAVAVSLCVRLWQQPLAWPKAKPMVVCVYTLLLVVLVVIPIWVVIPDPDPWFLIVSLGVIVISGVSATMLIVHGVRFGLKSKRNGTSIRLDTNHDEML